MGHVLCADCGKVVALHFDGEQVRLAVHDVCGMGGKPLEVNFRALRLAEALRRSDGSGHEDELGSPVDELFRQRGIR